MSLIDGLRLALLDKKLYIMIAINMCIIGAIGCQNFFPTMTATLGYNHVISLLLIATNSFQLLGNPDGDHVRGRMAEASAAATLEEEHLIAVWSIGFWDVQELA